MHARFVNATLDKNSAELLTCAQGKGRPSMGAVASPTHTPCPALLVLCSGLYDRGCMIWVIWSEIYDHGYMNLVICSGLNDLGYVIWVKCSFLCV